MKILHTSDWHLGRSLYGRKRYEEFSLFLNWLVDVIKCEKVDVLLVAGDIFDTNTPSNSAQGLYYRFLCHVSMSCCRHVVIIAGNHDSPSFLNAPKEILRALNVYVVGSITKDPAEEVIILKNKSQTAQITSDNVEAIICAIPYLRDKDIRTTEPGESIDDKNRKLVQGIKEHYTNVVSIAEGIKINLQKSLQTVDKYIPIIAMGHLFTAGGKTITGDGVRELYVGSLAYVGEEVFPSAIDYLALGHLHIAQKVGNADHIRYCGSPIPMGYGEATQTKKVILVEFKSAIPNIKEISVPCFQKLVRITGSLNEIYTDLEELKNQDSAAWLEIEYTGKEIISNLREMIEEVIVGSNMEIRRIKNLCIMKKVINKTTQDETLDNLDVEEVFKRCLDAFKIPKEDGEDLLLSYKEIINSIYEEDINKE